MCHVGLTVTLAGWHTMMTMDSLTTLLGILLGASFVLAVVLLAREDK